MTKDKPYKFWPASERKKLKEYWKQAEGDRDKFKELALADPIFKKKRRSWDSIQQEARRAKIYKGAKLSKRYAFSRLPKTDRADLERLLKDFGLVKTREDKRFSGFSERQLRNFARGASIQIHKDEKPGPKTDDGKVQQATEAVPKTPQEIENELITQRESDQISVVEFIDGLPEGGELRIYWDNIKGLLTTNRTLRNTELLKHAEEKNVETLISGRSRVHRLDHTKGVLGHFVKWDALSEFKVKKDKEPHQIYLCNLPAFYQPEELFKILPHKEVQVVTDLLIQGSQDLEILADKLGKVIGRNLLETLLTHYVGLGLFKYDRKSGNYSLTERGQELGLDEQSIKTIKATALENAVFAEEEEAGSLPSSLEDVADALQRDIAKKTVPRIDLTKEIGSKDLKLLCVGEVLYGSQYTDQKLLNWILGVVKDPALVITSGLVQGRFEVRNKAKSKMLAEEGSLYKIESQFHTAGMLLDGLERIVTNRVCVILGDDDWRLADDYGTLMHLAEGKNPWKFGVSWSSFSAEMKRRLENKELRRKIRIQWETIQTYMFRIGRSLLNKKEVRQKIGIYKSEYRLIIEIMVAKRNNIGYPKVYEKVVNVDALYGNIGKRIVTPDPLRLLVAEGKEIRMVHNAGFSDITQYQNTIQHLDAVARHLGLSRQELPWVLADFHQESFYAEYLMGTWIMNLPGMQNTMPASAYTMTEWSTRILEAKERRQSRVRKEPVSPSAPEITFCSDGRIRFRILSHAVMKVLEEQKGEPEQNEVGILGTDWQFGSITNWPEYVAKFLDYGLIARRAQHFWVNGDGIHGGGIYPQHNAENRPMRLIGLHPQQKFFFNLVTPIVLDAPALTDLAAWLGNHEWNNMSAKFQGDSPLTFLETGLQGILMERKRVGTESPLEKAMTVSRIRWLDTHNPAGDIVNWPFYADTICGFKVAIQHMWQPFGDQNPAGDIKIWLKKMAKAARSIDLLLGGHKHSVWMAQLGDKLAVSAGAAAGMSGYELQRGLFSTVMFTLVEFSNKTGITVEFVPWEFLEKYEFQCPAYKGKDKLFIRPAPGTEDYKRGKMSPFIENMIDDLTHYLEV